MAEVKEGSFFAGEILGFILGLPAVAAGARDLAPLDRLPPEPAFQPKTRQGFLQILGLERDVSRFGIRGITIRFKARIHGFRHKRGYHLLTGVDRRTGTPLASRFPIYADAAGHFLVMKDFVTSLGVITEHEDAIFLPFGALTGRHEDLEPFFCLFSVITDHPGVLFSDGFPIDEPRVFADHWAGAVPVPGDNRLDPVEEAVIALTSAVIRVDGVIKPEEIQVVRKFFAQVFHGQPGKMGRVRATLNAYLKSPPDLDQAYAAMEGRGSHEKQIVVALLLNIASSDGELDRSELALIDGVRRRFGIPDADFAEMAADFQPEDFPLYQALGVSPGATWDQIREAYRQKMKDYHPDLYPNLPESFRAFAKQEYHRINEAYEALRRKFG